ncbi:prenyl cysteine carboxyl methyltransferas-like protein Ste14 [Byssothecium circinans]|uniref:Protein-S-isoprenylcysteine O-methyltransferase n=1 Tax=Byssothecium circinans TaxID=147558 RepID=A0A6A5UAW5_9PLEO|nr:prenyl cysteine carboxyl methyltransferas-like protein Ste14 [Byssothecium circinans]
MAALRNGTASKPDISFPMHRPVEKGEWTPGLDAELRTRQQTQTPTQTQTVDLKKDNSLPRACFPGGDRSLSAIAIRAFLLGVVGTACAFLTIVLAHYQSRLWRPFFFVTTLSLFHFLEFWITAEFNTPTALVSSFLLTNGDRYRQAHTVALVETFFTSLFLPSWQARVNPPWVIALGLAMIVVGQAVRSTAMAQAGTNFNHQVQSRKSDGHELVTRGLYAHFRHPSYFGFFWWGIGTQVALGNTISFIAYTAILWYFFKKRITHEEKHLLEFFGEDYKAYRARTRVWIPFI